MPGSQWEEGVFSPLIPLLPPRPGLGPDPNSAPVPLRQLGLFLPGAGAQDEDEAMVCFLISTCPSWPTLGTQHPALDHEQGGKDVRLKAVWRAWLEEA